MQSNFEKCLSHVLQFEGGYVNDPNDPGGETNMGISRRSYPNENIRAMTRGRAAQIYRRDYWDKVQGDKLPSGLDLVAFDAAVNSGVSRGAKWLQEAIGVRADGVIGTQTIQAAHAAQPVAAIDRACDKRLSFLRGLSTWRHYSNGWTRRVESVRDLATAMSETPAKPDITPTPMSEPAWLTALLAFLKSLFGGR